MDKDNIIIPFDINEARLLRAVGRVSEKIEKRFEQLVKNVNARLENIDADPREIAKLNREIGVARGRLQEYRRAVKRANDEQEKMAKSAKQSADGAEKLGKGARGAGRSLLNIGNIVKGLGIAGLATGFAGLAQSIIEFGNASLEAFGKFQTGINEVATLLPNLSEQGLGELEDQVLDLSVAIGRTTEDTIPALYQALSAGVPQENVFEFLKQANESAVAGNTSLTTSVDALSSVVNAYGEDVLNVQQASDIFFTTIRNGKTTFEELARSIAVVAPLSASLGVDFADVGASLASLTATGVPTAQALTQIRSALTELSNPTTVIAQQFESLSGKSFKQFISDGNTLGDALQVVKDISTETGKEFTELFGTIEGATAVTILTDDLEKLNGFIEESRDSLGATSDAFDRFDGSLERNQQLLEAQQERLKILTGEALEPYRLKWLETRIALLEAGTAIIETKNAIIELDEGIEALEGFNRLQLNLTGVTETLNIVSHSLRESGISNAEYIETVNQLAEGVDLSSDALLEKREALLLEALAIVEAQKRNEEFYAREQAQTQARLEGIRALEEEQEGLRQQQEALNRESLQQLDDLVALAPQLETVSQLTEEQAEEIAEVTKAYRDGNVERTEALALIQGIAGETANANFVLQNEIELQEAQLTPLQRLNAEKERLASRTAELVSEIQNGNITREEAVDLLGAEFDITSSLIGVKIAEANATLVQTQSEKELANALRDRQSAQQAIGSSGSRINDLLSGSGTRSTGGGGGRDTAGEIAKLREEGEAKFLEIRIESEEKINEIRTKAEGEIAQIRSDQEKEIAGIRESTLAREIELRSEIAKIEAQALEDFNRQQSTSFLQELKKVQDGTAPQTEEERNRGVVQGRAEAGASLPEIRALAEQLGVAVEEELDQAFAEYQRQLGLEAIEQATELTAEQTQEALARLNEQIANGQEIDLSEFGIEIQTAEEAVAEASRLRQAELVQLQKDSQAEILAVQKEAQAETLAIQKEAQAEIVSAQKEATDAQIEAQNKLVEAIERVAQSQQSASSSSISAINDVSNSLEAQRLQQLLNDASNAESLDKQIELTQQALDYAVASELITQAQADQELQTILLEIESTRLFDSLDLVNQATRDGETNAQNLDQALDLLQSGVTTTAEESAIYAGILSKDLIPRFIELRQGGLDSAEALRQLGVDINELPEETQVLIETNADEAIGEVDAVRQALDEINGKVVNARIEIREETTVSTGGQGAGSVPVPDDTEEFMGGGHTGRGNPNEIAGVVHKEELVIPLSARRRGIDGIVNFVKENDPDVGRIGFVPPIPTSSPFLAPTITNINNTTTNIGGASRSGDTVNNRISLTLEGRQAERAVDGVLQMMEVEKVNTFLRRS